MSTSNIPSENRKVKNVHINLLSREIESTQLAEKKDNRPRLDVRLEGYAVNALLDSGSNISAISTDFYHKLPKRPKWMASPAKITAANGNHLKLLGIALMQVETQERFFLQRIFVIEGLRSTCILGADFLATAGIKLDCQRKRILFPRKQEPLTKSEIETWTLVSASKFTLAPRTERLVPTRTSKPLPSFLAVVTALNEPSEVQVTEALLQTQYNLSPSVLLSNPTDHPISFRRAQPIACLSEASETDVLYIDAHMTELQLKGETRATNHHHKAKWSKKAIQATTNLANIPEKFHQQYIQLLHDYSDIFSVDPNDIGKCDVVTQRITLKDANKVACTPPYRIPHHLKEVAVQYVHKLLSAGVIQKSTSPFCSPLMLVRKPNAEVKGKSVVEQYRVVHDFRRLNANTVRDSYPLHNLYELIDNVAQAKIWSLIDLSSGFWNQVLDKSSRAYTAFGLPGLGHWEYTRSAQGLCNSSSAFQRLLDYIVRGLTGVQVYIDDVILSSQTHAEHLAALQQVFTRFRKYNLKCRLSKLQLGVAEVNYLGYNISQSKGIRAGAAKTEAIQKWTAPRDVKEVKQFLGLCSFFRRTIPHFAETASALTKLTRKDSTWKEGPLPQAALSSFEQLKLALTSRPCLQPVNFGKEFILTVDASTENGLGAILSQQHEDGIERACAYASRALTEAEKKWAPFHVEHLAMLWACKHFKPYLMGKHFVLRTDHKPLLTLNKVQGNAMDRIRAELEEFQPFTVTHLAGKTMPADALSRRPLPRQVQEMELAHGQVGARLTWEQLFHLQKQDPYCKTLACYLKYGLWPQNASFQRYIKAVAPKIQVLEGVLIRKHQKSVQVLVPHALRPTLFALCHDHPMAGHFSTQKTLERLQTNWWWPGMQTDAEAYCRECHTCNTVNLPHSKRPVPLRSLGVPMRFNERVHADLLGPLPKESEEARYVLVLTDAFTKWVELIPLPDKTAANVARAIQDKWICRHSVFDVLVTDQGKEFTANVVKSLRQMCHFQHNTTSAGHPQSNGQCERFNRTILAYMRKYIPSHFTWVSLLPNLQMAYNTTPQSSHGHTPYYLVYAKHPSLPHELVFPNALPSNYPDLSLQLQRMHETTRNVHLLLEEAFHRQKTSFDTRTQRRRFKIGDLVYVTRAHSGPVFQKFQPLYFGPCTVIQILDNDNYRLDYPSRRAPLIVHANRIKPLPFVQQHIRIISPPKPPPPEQALKPRFTAVSVTEPKCTLRHHHLLGRPAPPVPYLPPPPPPSSSSSSPTEHIYASPTLSRSPPATPPATDPLLPTGPQTTDDDQPIFHGFSPDEASSTAHLPTALSTRSRAGAPQPPARHSSLHSPVPTSLAATAGRPTSTQASTSPSQIPIRTRDASTRTDKTRVSLPATFNRMKSFVRGEATPGLELRPLHRPRGDPLHRDSSSSTSGAEAQQKPTGTRPKRPPPPKKRPTADTDTPASRTRSHRK